ncbi:MAG: AraC family transcriptional regulator [Propioniciclava sp.]
MTRLLNETSASVTEISKRVGFANVTHFNRVFKQVTGMSPMASRRSAGAKSTGTAS